MKRVSIIVVGVIVILSLLAPQIAQAKDLDGHWSKKEIDALVQKGHMKGYPDGTFQPDKPVKRAEFATLLVKSLELDVASNGNTTSPFSDVESGDWFYQEVITASKLKLIKGDPGGTFRPNEDITREEMADVIDSALKYKEINSKQESLHFKDNKNIQGWAKEAVQRLLYLGIITGKNNNKFDPQGNTKRGESAAVINRMLNIIENPKVVTTATHYNYSFKKVSDAQMKVSPQTDGPGAWLHASKGMVEYYINPNNFKENSTDYYQFLDLSQSVGLSEKEVNDKVLHGKGILSKKGASFIEAGSTLKMNEVYLIAHTLLETGNGTSDLAKGIEVGVNKDSKPVMVTTRNRSSLKKIKTVYNMYGVGANDNCPIECGSARAYEEKWTTPELAIVGGAKFVREKYIDVGQNTLYKMRWNPDHLVGNNNAHHQYATDVGWATKQTSRISNIYKLLDSYVLRYDVPVFASLPASTTRPTGLAKFHVYNGTVNTKLVGEKGKTTASSLNYRTGPSTNYYPLRSLSKGTAFTIIGSNSNSSWYKVKVGAAEGWVSASASYIKLDKDVKASSINSLMEADLSDVSPLIGITNYSHVPLLEEPQLTGNVSSILTIDTEVNIIDQADDWYKVNFADTEGWIHEAYLNVK